MAYQDVSSSGMNYVTLSQLLGDYKITVDTDDYFAISKVSATLGGSMLLGIAEADGATDKVFDIVSYGGTPSNGKTTNINGLINVRAYETNTSGALLEAATASNIFCIQAYIDLGGGSLGTRTRMMVDSDGDIYSVTSAQTFDDHDDVGLISAYDMTTAPDQVIRTDYEDFAKYNEDDLIKAGVLGDKVSEGGMTNVTQLQRLHNGAIRQLGRMLTETRMELAEARKEIKQLAA